MMIHYEGKFPQDIFSLEYVRFECNCDIVFYKDKKWIELNHDVIDDVSSRIQKPQSYPLKICFSNPYC